MNRRSFLKFCGIAPVVPGLAVEVLEPKIYGFMPTHFVPGGFSWDKFINWKTAKDLAAFKAEHTYPEQWQKVIAEAFPPLDQKMKEHRDKVLQNIRLMEASNEVH